jgi:ComF family protein
MGPHDGLLRDVILRIKHPGGETIADMLGRLFADTVASRAREFGCHLVIPVPLHWRRRLSRGYNQSEALADALAKRLRLPLRHRWLRRRRNTPPQTSQSPAARRMNPRGAFHCLTRRELRGQSILLVDDVLTTGTTCSEASRALLDVGAARVFVAVVVHAQA